jgi:hypothetical protein
MKLFSRLPYDIIYIIIPYTYQLQNKTLLEDIRHYYKSKNDLLEFYLLIYLSFTPSSMNNNQYEKYLLVTDLFMDILFNIRSYKSDFLTRVLLVNTPQQVDRYIFHLKNKNINSQINILWGLFTPEERTKFMYEYQENYLRNI